RHIQPGELVFCVASVLYQAQVRHLLMWIAIHHGCFKPRWSNRVQDEWTGSLLKACSPETQNRLKARLNETRLLMDQHVPEGLVTEYEDIESSVVLPDPDDRHVLAAAIKCGASILLTENVRDFPRSVLLQYTIDLCTVDAFLEALSRTFPADVANSVQEILDELNSPKLSLKDYCEALASKGYLRAALSISRLFT
ncbi:MAG: PIN domain-containing protein, partial [Chlamydiia bacterium]|nr:PIN domain-containing protein [Chlamydiia bacterium]